MIDRNNLHYQQGYNIKELINEARVEFHKMRCPLNQYRENENKKNDEISKEDIESICHWCSFNSNTIDFYNEQNENVVVTLCNFLDSLEDI